MPCFQQFQMIFFRKRFQFIIFVKFSIFDIFRYITQQFITRYVKIVEKTFSELMLIYSLDFFGAIRYNSINKSE